RSKNFIFARRLSSKKRWLRAARCAFERSGAQRLRHYRKHCARRQEATMDERMSRKLRTFARAPPCAKMHQFAPQCTAQPECQNEPNSTPRAAVLLLGAQA